MRRWAAVGLVAAMAGWWALGAEPAAPLGGLRGAPAADGLWVATFNLNFERPSARTAAAVAALEAELIVLQESTPAWEALLEEALGERLPYRRFWHHPAEGGQAVLSDHPLLAVEVSQVEGGFPAHCATVQAPWGPLRLLHLHLRPPLDDEGRLLLGFFTTGPRRLAELRAHQDCGGGAHDLVLGDLNEGEGPSLEALAAEGFVEAQRVHGPPEETWSWQTALGTLTGRPDHVLAAPSLAVGAVRVVDGGESDHRPLLVQVHPR